MWGGRGKGYVKEGIRKEGGMGGYGKAGVHDDIIVAVTIMSSCALGKEGDMRRDRSEGRWGTKYWRGTTGLPNVRPGVLHPCQTPPVRPGGIR